MLGIIIVLWVLYLLRTFVLPFAVGLYLPLSLSTPIMIGAIVRQMLTKKDKDKSKKQIGTGILLGSGLIAGEAIVGILLAFMVTITASGHLTFLKSLNFGHEGGWMGGFNKPVSFIIFLALALYFMYYSRKNE